MDVESTSAIKFLQAITEVHTALGEFAGRLRERPDVKVATVYHFSSQTRYFGEYNPDGSFMSYCGCDFGVSAELNSGAVVDWWIELGWNATNWRVEYNVHKHDSDEDGSHIVIPFSEWKATSLNAFIQKLTGSVEELVASASDEALFS